MINTVYNISGARLLPNDYYVSLPCRTGSTNLNQGDVP